MGNSLEKALYGSRILITGGTGSFGNSFVFMITKKYKTSNLHYGNLFYFNKNIRIPYKKGIPIFLGFLLKHDQKIMYTFLTCDNTILIYSLFNVEGTGIFVQYKNITSTTAGLGLFQRPSTI